MFAFIRKFRLIIGGSINVHFLILAIFVGISFFLGDIKYKKRENFCGYFNIEKIVISSKKIVANKILSLKMYNKLDFPESFSGQTFTLESNDRILLLSYHYSLKSDIIMFDEADENLLKLVEESNRAKICLSPSIVRR